ncbi:MAG: photosystem reaction center subunit, partial [Rhodospirillales bacterium]|nr:photosystem reaction center subunit [Rhodospirillales bacterium]
PVPWSVLDYNEDKNGYVIPMSEEEIKNAPAYDLSDLVKNDADLGKIRDRSYDYYKVPRDLH